MEEWITVAHIDAIPDDRGKVVEVEGRQIALFRVEGAVHAIDNRCPHEGGPLGAGPFQNGVVTCPWHQWRFDVRTGALIVAPSRKVARFDVRLAGDEVQIDAAPLVAPRKRNEAILARLSAGQSAESLARDYGLSVPEVESATRQARIGARLIWLGECLRRQGDVSVQDLIHLPYRDHHSVSCEAQTRLDALIKML